MRTSDAYVVRDLNAPRTSKEHIEGFRARVGETASVLYAKGGEGAITMREIARALGSSPMGLYRDFRDRDEIIAYLRTGAFNNFAQTLETAFAKGGNPFARAREVGRAYLDFALDNTGLLPADVRSQPTQRARE